MKQRFDQLEREVLAAIHKERAADRLLGPRERIKKQFNLPDQLPAQNSPGPSVPVLSLAHWPEDVPSIVVVNRGGMGLRIPEVLFTYLYRQGSLAADDWRTVNTFLVQSGMEPEPL
jgi:hypothetical protein